MAKWAGYTVSVSCGEGLGHFQGTIVDADSASLTLCRPFRNGLPYAKSEVTLKAVYIKSLKIIECPSSESRPEQSIVCIANRKKHTVSEALQATPSPGKPVARSKPIDIQNKQTRGTAAGSGGRRRGKDYCLAETDASDPALARDFDFQTNLALFDKAKLWREMNEQPDLVRQTEEGRAMYRHDENVLGGRESGPLYLLPEGHRAPVSYVTDRGLTVPSAAGDLRRTMLNQLRAAGLLPASLVLLGRALADLALRLLPGPHCRIALLAADDWRGAASLVALRLLAAYGHEPTALLLPAAEPEPVLPEERRLYEMAGGMVVRETAELQEPDLLVLATAGLAAEEAVARRWAGALRCGAVLVEPTDDRPWRLSRARAALVASPPPALEHQTLSGVALYAAELCLPPPLLNALGMVWSAADRHLLRLHEREGEDDA